MTDLEKLNDSLNKLIQIIQNFAQAVENTMPDSKKTQKGDFPWKIVVPTVLVGVVFLVGLVIVKKRKNK